MRRSPASNVHRLRLIMLAAVLASIAPSCRESTRQSTIVALAGRGARFEDATGVSSGRIDVARIAVADLSNVRDVASDDLTFLRDARELQTLILGGPQIDDRALPSIMGAKNLSWLMLHGTSITSDGARQLSSLPLLKQISLMGESVDDKFVESLRGCAELESLTLFRCPASLASIRLAEFPRLRVLKIYDCAEVQAKGLVRALQGTNLEAVRLAMLQSPLDDLFVESLGRDVSVLEIINCPLSDGGAKKLASLTNLTELHLLATPISAEACEAIAQLSALSELRIGVANDSMRCLAEISKLGNLRTLEFHAPDLSDDAVPYLRRLTGLQTLTLGAGLSPSGLDALRQALSKCTISAR